MGRRASTFRERDVTCALRVVRNAGCDVIRVSIDKAGKIEIITSDEPVLEARS